jgi:hypothetical protein
MNEDIVAYVENRINTYHISMVVPVEKKIDKLQATLEAVKTLLMAQVVIAIPIGVAIFNKIF